MTEPLDVVVVGGGMTGLAAADALAAKGLSVHVVDAAEVLGGLARSIPVAGEDVEAYYHHVFPQDRELPDLIDELGHAGDLEWRRPSTAVLDGGHLYPFDTPLDLLRFPTLPFVSRLRLGMGSAVAMVLGRNLDGSGVRIGSVRTTADSS